MVFFGSELAAVPDSTLVLPTIARTLGVQEEGNRPLRDCLIAALRNKSILLLLDNFEHVVDRAIELPPLLAVASEVKVLVTSRSSLRITGEHEIVVPSLPVPDMCHLPALDRLTDYPAVVLFVARAQAVKADFTLTPENGSTVAGICIMLDGLPLAIELAAAWIKVLPPHLLLEQLNDRFTLLAGRVQDVLSHHRALQHAIDRSYDLLDTWTQTCFRWLGVFVGGWTLEAATVICGNLAPRDLERAVTDRPRVIHSISHASHFLTSLAILLDQSLVQRTMGAHNEPRYTMLETIRTYAWERLVASGEAEVLRQRHEAYYFALAKTTEVELMGSEQAVWLNQLESEHGNLRAALRWTIDSGAVESATSLASALGRFWLLRGHLSEGRQWFAEVLAYRTQPAPVRAKATCSTGMLALYQGDYLQANALFEESLALSHECGDTRGIATVLSNLGNMALDQDDYARASELIEESLTMRRMLDDTFGIAASLNNLGLATLECGDHHRAVMLFEESLAAFRQVGETLGVAHALHNLGLAALHKGAYARSVELCIKSLMIRRQSNDQLGIILSLEGLACIVGACEEPARAVQLYGAAQALCEAIGAPGTASNRRLYEQTMAAARTQLGERAWTVALVEGREMILDQAVDAALAWGTTIKAQFGTSC